MDEKIILLAEFHRAGFLFSEKKTSAQVQITDDGIFVRGEKVTDIFFNNIQLRLYISGNFKTDSSSGNTWKYSFYMIFDDNENDAGLSFLELHKKISASFVPVQA